MVKTKKQSVPKKEKKDNSMGMGWICPVCGAGMAPWMSTCGCHVRTKVIYIQPPTIPIPAPIYVPSNPCVPNISRTGDPMPPPFYTVSHS